MRTWMKWAVPIVVMVTLLAALVLQACHSQVSYSRGSTPAPAAAPGTRSAGVGFQSDSLGLSAGRDYRDTPRIDMEATLNGLAIRPREDVATGFETGRTGRSGSRESLAPWSREQRASQPAPKPPSTPPPPPAVVEASPALDRRHHQDAATPRFTATEELWVISRYVAHEPREAGADDVPGCGALVCSPPVPAGEAAKVVPVPLKHTEVNASILGWIATVNVQQQFHNPFSSKIEAVYVFPLPENAAVNEFVMTVGERKIRGVIRERQEAERIYSEAKAQGYTASLLTQERPNIFTQSVANIEPGKRIDIDITYFHTMSYHDGGFDFVFPMVVGPRFNPPGTADGVAAVPRLAHPGASGQATEVQYLRPTERSGHDIAVTVEIEAGVGIEKIVSRTHAIDVKRGSADPGRATVRLASTDSIPNKDFVLRYEVAGDKVKSGLLVQADRTAGGTPAPLGRGKGGYFALMIVPPAELAHLPRSPMEIVFVVDRSGSMSGQPIEQAKLAVERGLKQLRAGDSFQIIDFAESASTLGPAPLEATPENIRRGLAYAAGLNSSGGTMMLNGLRAALSFPHDPERLRVVAFLTDGFIGNEAEILRAMDEKLGATRVFGFGVGSSPNRYLLAEMSRLGRGAVAYVGLQDPAGEVMDLFFERISRPAMADLSFDWGGARVSDVFPARTPDLFVGRPVILTGRYEGDWSGTVKVRGRAGGEEREILVGTDGVAVGQRPPGGTPAPLGALPAVWARMKIGSLSDRALLDGLVDAQVEVKRVALEYGLMSAFTAFVAVDSMTRPPGDSGTTVVVPVNVPEGVRYETTVGTGPGTDRR